MNKFIFSAFSIFSCIGMTQVHAEFSFQQELQQNCAQVKSFAATGKKLYDQKNYTKALESFKNQAAWSSFCKSNADESGVQITENEISIAHNNVGLTYAKLAKPLWARAWFQLDPKNKSSQFNLKQLPKVKKTSDFSGQYVNYAGYGAWGTITVKKQNNRYMVNFSGLYMGLRSLIYGPNMGQFSTTMPLNKLTATYKYEDCKIDLKFGFNSTQGNLVKIQQNPSDASCGFGMNVSADGTYQKVEK